MGRSKPRTGIRLPRLLMAQPPPPHYYAENLLAVVRGVQDQYGDLLTASETAFGNRILAASPPAQRLLARLLSRKGHCARVDSLDYREVEDAPGALGELLDAGLIAHCPPLPDIGPLRLLTRGEIERCFPELDARRRKPDLVAEAAARHAPVALHERVARHFPWVALAEEEHFDCHRLLFFGHRRGDLAAFVLRDLGLTRFEPYELRRERRLFQHRADFEEFLALGRIGDFAQGLGATPNLALAQLVLEALWHPASQRLFEHRRSRILNSLGRRLERSRQFDAALACYARSTLPPRRERSVRILHRLGDGDAVARLRAAMRSRPASALEADFAGRFGTARRPSLRVDRLPWPGPLEQSVEATAAQCLTAQGGEAWHLENALPLGLFGLAYWDWVFAPVQGMFVNAFQTAPIDLFWPDFFAARRHCCQDPLELADGPLLARMSETGRTRRGIANRLVDWRALSAPTLDALLSALPAADIRKLVGIVAADLERARTGFPDLTVIHGPGVCEFVEVKGPNDQLRHHQRLWLERLNAAGLPARVLRFR